MKKVIIIVLDSLGVGAMPDAAAFGDAGSATLQHIAAAVGGLRVPAMQRMGLGNIVEVQGVPAAASPTAGFGRMAEQSPAKDTVTGHWELAGLISTRPFALYPEGFPSEIIGPFIEQTGHEILWNKAASGTEILERLGEEHMRTRKLIVYTSADSVFQIAAHEEVIPLAELYRVSEIARRILDPFKVARVIARPFVGSPGKFQRTYNRKDFSMVPPCPTLLDHLSRQGIPVLGVGKIHDIFAGQGVTESVHTEGNRDGLEHTLRLHRESARGLVFVNLVDFDMTFGHRRNARGYAAALEQADEYIGRLAQMLTADDALILTADHGCDPTHFAHTDHTREYVPVLLCSPGLPPGRNLGTRSTFADVAATVGKLFGLSTPFPGTPLC